MDSFEIDSVKSEKANAMMRYHRIQNIAIFFRFLEVCLVLFFLCWFSARLPIAVRISGDYFRHLAVILISPRFVFFVGNAIVVVLFAKSGTFSGGNSVAGGTDLYDEFVKNRENLPKIRSNAVVDEIVYEDKTVCPEYRDTVLYNDTDMVGPYRRSVSERLQQEKKPDSCRDLRRSETDVCRKVENSGGKSDGASDSDEDMSNEEFQRRIEAFIAKQLRFQREESKGIVVQQES